MHACPFPAVYIATFPDGDLHHTSLCKLIFPLPPPPPIFSFLGLCFINEGIMMEEPNPPKWLEK
jgi:hypothetical protein